MKAIGSMILALAIVAMAATNASATAFVWYSTPNVNGNGSDAAVPGGERGQQLNLLCDTSLPGQCSWTIDMNVRTNISTWISWATNLSTADVGKGLVVSNVQEVQNGTLFDNSHTGGIGAGGNALLTGSNGRRTSVGIANNDVAGAPYTLIRFTLSKPAGTNLEDSAVINATNALGAIQWSKSGFPATEAVSYAGAPAVNGNVAGGGPVINVTNFIPEPATLGMLVIGGLALIRRRIG